MFFFAVVIKLILLYAVPCCLKCQEEMYFLYKFVLKSLSSDYSQKLFCHKVCLIYFHNFFGGGVHNSHLGLF